MNRKRKGSTPAREWTEFVRVTHATNRVTGEVTPVPGDVALYGNNLYNVIVRRLEPGTSIRDDAENTITLGKGWPPVLWLSISRRDRKTVLDWRHLQRIKNELVGEDCEAVQLFPASDRLVDGANQFHLWALAKPGLRFPFGYQERAVFTPEELADDPTSVGAVQREWEFEL